MNKRANRNILRITLVVGILVLLVVSNVFFTVITGVHYRSGVNVRKYKDGSTTKSETIYASRGKILDRDGEVIAQDMATYRIIAYLDKSRKGIGDSVAYVDKPKETSQKLAEILNADEEVLYKYLTQENMYQTYLGNAGSNLTTTQKEAIEKLGLHGIEFEKSVQRVYPTGMFASHLIGFAQSEDVETDGKIEKKIIGKMGIEQYLNEELTGKDGKKTYNKDGKNNVIAGTENIVNPIDGNDVYLTIEKDIQVALEDALDSTMKEMNCKRAWAIIMEVKTGKILGWASYPSFDLNEKNITNYQNMISESQYEPGSVMKSFTYASAIDSGVYNGNATFRSGKFHFTVVNGKAVRVPSATGSLGTIGDAEGNDWGYISYDEGLIRSANTGICSLLTEVVEPEVFEKYLTKFGFFKEVGVEGVNEAKGQKVFNYPIEKLTTGFGQGSTVTALQLMQAYSAIFGNGKMVKPYYIDKIVDPYTNEIIYQGKKEYTGQPIKKETAKLMREKLYGVFNSPYGTGKAWKLDGVEMVGKTGTGETVDENGHYSHSNYIKSVMVGAPADDPEIMMYYAYEGSHYRVYDTKFFKNAFKQALISTGVTSESTTTSDVTTDYDTWQEYTMPSLTNHTLEYAYGKLNGMDINKIVIGNGTSVVKQYPEKESTIVTKQNVFLLTEGTTITMPNMIGWTRKDVQTFANIAKVKISIKGSGTVVSQSVNAGTAVNGDTVIEIELK